MQKLTRTFGLVALSALAISLTGCANQPSNQVTAADANMLQRLDVVMRAAATDVPLQVRLERDQVQTGETIQLGAASPKGGYLYLFQLGTEGKQLSLIFPNAIDGANYLAPNTVLQLPRAQWKMNTSGPAGMGYILAVLTPKPMDLMALQADVSKGVFNLPSGYGSALVPWREVAP